MTPDVNQNNTPVQENQQQQNQPPVQATQEDINWKLFREQREKERKERVEIEARVKQKEEEAAALKSAMDALLNKPSHQQHEYQEEDEDAKLQKKIEAMLAQKESQMRQEQLQREQMETPQKLQQAYGDFNKVCSTENLDYFEYHYPEVAKAYGHMPDGFEKWSSIYKAVKRFVPNASETKKQDAIIERNTNKPQSMTAGGATSTGDAAPIMLDDKRRQENWKRMQSVMRKTS